MFREDREIVDQLVADWYSKLMSSKIGRIIFNHEFAGMNKYVATEGGAITWQRMLRAGAVRGRVNPLLYAEGRGLMYESPGAWKLVTVDDAMYSTWIRSRARLCNQIDKATRRLRQGVDELMYLKHPEEFDKLVTASNELLAVAETSKPNKKMMRYMRRLENQLDEFKGKDEE